ncbi:hypothetical protein [Frankia gtarii]|uniref:hypothetical protein n=1 Tax=Frankia gtarii TaxID=2950102 RepID=UPI003F687570
MGQDLFGTAGLDEPAVMQHANLVGDLADNREVVRDEKIAEPGAAGGGSSAPRSQDTVA